MALALESLTFSVETKELENAILKMKELGQAASSLNKPIDQLGKTTESSSEDFDKFSAAVDKFSSAVDGTSSKTKNFSKNSEDMGKETDAVANKIERLGKQLGYLRNDQELSATGFTKSQASIMAWADTMGGTESQLRELAKITDDFNRIMGEQALDKSVAGYNMLQRQLREFAITQELAAKNTSLTGTQIKQLTRDMEVLRQQNEALGRDSETGITALKDKYISAANDVNKLLAAARDQEKASRDQANAFIQLAKTEQDLINQEQKLQFVTQKTAEGFTVASANALYRYELALKKAGVTEQEFISRSNAYSTALKARQDVSDTNKQRIQATQELIRIEQQLADQEKFMAYAMAEFNKSQSQATQTNQAYADSLTMGSLRALFAYEQALKRAGVAEQEVTAKTAAMRQQMLQMQQATEGFNGSVNHLGRNVGVQFTDIFVSLYNGQPVMQVITQQGGQLADAFLLAGVSGANMSQHLVDGFKKILESYKLLFAAFGGLAAAGIDKLLDPLVASTGHLYKAFAKTTPEAERLTIMLAGMKDVVATSSRMFGVLSAVTIASLATEFAKADFFADKLNKTLVLSGATMGITAEQGNALAMQVGAGLEAGIGSARDAILAFAKEGVAVTEQAVTRAVEMNTYLGVSFEDAASKAALFKKEPLSALIELAQKTGEVDAATLQHVASLVLEGNQQEAVKAAIEAKDKAETAAIARAKAGLSGVSAAWIDIKKNISQSYDSTVEFLTTSKDMRMLFAGVGILVTGIFHAVAKSYEGIRGIVSVLTAAMSGSVDAINNAVNESASRINGLDASASKMYGSMIKFATSEASANNEAAKATAARAEANAKYAGKFKKEHELLAGTLTDINKADADRMTKQDYINAKLKEQMRQLGFVTEDQKLLNALTTKYGEEWDKANSKKKSKPSTASTAFNTNTGNELKTIKEDYNRQLQAEQDFQRDALATMQSYYKAGYSTSTEYFAQQQDLIIKSRQQQLQILDNYNKEELAAFDEKQKQLEANALQAKQRGANPDDVNKKLAVAQANLARERANFVSMISGKEEQVWSESIKLAAKELDEITKSTAEFNKTVDDYNKQLDKQASERNLQLELQQQSIGLSEQEKAVFEAKTRATIQHTEAIQKMQKEIESAEQYALDLVNAFAELGQPVPFDVSMAMFDRILQAKQAKEKANVKGIAEVEQQAIAANTLYQIKEYEKLNAALSDAISTALFEGGEQGKKKLRDIIVAELSKPITLQINAFVNSVLSDVIGKPNNDSYVQNTTSSILDTIGVLNSAYKLVNNSISSSITKGFTSFATSDIGIKMGLGTSNVSAVGPVKPSLTSTGTAVNSALTMAGNAYAGYGLQKSISGGYVTGEKGIVDAATVIASAISGPIAGVVGGTVNRAFGRKLKDQGLEGTFGGADGFDGNSYEFYKGGWFRSDKTKRKALDSGVEDALETQFKALQTQTAMMAQTLGLGVDSVVNFTSKIKVSFKGLSEEQINERMAEEFGKVAESMTSAALGTTEYTRTGETAVETLTRLSSSLTTVNGTFDVLGKTLYASTLAGADMASQLVDLMGGIEQFTATSASYLENFYTEAERTADATRQLTDALASVGVDAMPATRDAYRDLVESQDLTTESGRETYAALMGLNGAFAALVPSADDLASALAETQTAIKDVFQELRDAIQGARDDVQSALYTISGPKAPRDFAKLTTAVSAVDVTAPSSQSVTTAKSALEQARNKPQYLSGAESYAEYWANLQAGTQAAFESAQQRATQTQGAVDARWQDVWNWSGGDRGSWQNYRDQINAGTWWEYDSNFSRAYRMSFKDWYNETTRLQGVANEAGLARTNAISANDSALAKKSEAQTSANTANAEWQSSITAAQDALTAAENDYLSSITGWVSTAKVSVETLGALKDETLAYYEAQQQLADGMRQSAANLRSSAQEAMRQTLSTDKALELRLADFDRAYTLALSTSGADKAGYADQMAAALPQLAQDIAAKSSSREDWQLAVAKLASKSSTVAAQLEAQAPVNLQAEANRVLGLIDGKLADLNTASVSAEQVIATAVNAGAARTAAGLQEVVKALTGETASASFAVGGYTGPGGKYEAAGVVHRGEVVFSQDDIARLGGVDVVEGLRTGEIPMFSNGGIVSSTGSAQTIHTATVDNTELVTELKSLREEVKMLRAEARATAMNTSKTARILDDTTQGGTELRVTAIQ